MKIPAPRLLLPALAVVASAVASLIIAAEPAPTAALAVRTCPHCREPLRDGESEHLCEPAPTSPTVLQKRKDEAHKLSEESKKDFDLRSSSRPKPDDLGVYIQDEAAAIALGKAFFWDVRVGSDSLTACATCHHQAGADARTRNLIHVIDDTQVVTSARNYQWTMKDLTEPKDSGLFLREKHIALGSPGVPLREFDGLTKDALPVEKHKPIDLGNVPDDGERQDLENLLEQFGPRRQATQRNGPSVINAIFSDRLFHDGRAASEFNGHDSFGPESPLPDPLGKWRTVDGVTEPVTIRIAKGTAASQAVGPVTQRIEMSYRGRGWDDVAAKLLDTAPLATQEVHAQDSALALYRKKAGKGLDGTYRDLIKKAFRPDWWAGKLPKKIPTGKDYVTGADTLTTDPMVANFSLYFGLAVLAYEAELVSDETPFDKFHRGDFTALTAAARRGWEAFRTVGCADCHTEPTFGGATVAQVRGADMENEPPYEEDAKPAPFPPGTEVVEWMKFPLPRPHLRPYDNGFYNLGVSEFFPRTIVGQLKRKWDHGIGGFVTGPVGAEEGEETLDSAGGNFPAQRQVSSKLMSVPPAAPEKKRRHYFSVARPKFGYRLSVDAGAFRTPSLRNVALTAPYMHNGAFATLEQVLGFYRVEPRFPNPRYQDGPDKGELIPNQDNNHPELEAVRIEFNRALAANEFELADLMAFLNALTDTRVPAQSAPFDHPSLRLVERQDDGGNDEFQEIPATGADGGEALPTWPQNLP